MSRESFELQKLRSYRLTLAETAEPVVVAEASAPTTWRSLQVSITAEQRHDGGTEQQKTTDLPERIEVFCLRDENDFQYGGIAQLTFGMLLKRTTTDGTRNAQPFIFQGQYLEQGRHYYRAVFERQKRVNQGR